MESVEGVEKGREPPPPGGGAAAQAVKKRWRWIQREGRVCAGLRPYSKGTLPPPKEGVFSGRRRRTSPSAPGFPES